jgi:hypothetical protein
MTRAVPTAAIDSDWRSVSQERPCPVCGKDDVCSVHTADDFACCAREPSEWKLTNGSWLHRIQASSTVAQVADVLGRVNPVANGNGIRL